MNAKLTARERMTRLLAVIPWVVEQDGAPLDEIATRFDYPRQQLVDDLTQVVLYVGVHPFTPDSLIEVDITDDRVQIRYADWFSQPLRLTPEEGARLLTAGRTVLSLGDDEQTTPLLRALAKLGVALGGSADSAVDVRLGDAPEATLGALREAIDAGRQVELDYYTYGRDDLTTRRVDPARVFSDHGNWYLHGFCHRAEDERVFRVDRIRDVRRTDDPMTHPLDGGGVSFSPDGDDPRIRLRLPPSAFWVTEQYPTEAVTSSDDGRLDVVMAVTAVPWLERLLLRLGPEAEVISADPPLDADLAARAAARILARYAD